MPDPPERFWTSRLRWRLRGAMQWPAFAVCTVIGGLILDRLPPVTTIGLNLIEGVLIATFANLFLIGALAPYLSKRLARRAQLVPAGGIASPPEVEYEVLRDRVATALLAVGLLACLAAGLANIRVVVAETEAREDALLAVEARVMHGNNEELKRNLEASDTARLGPGFFRQCIPTDERDRVCFTVETDKDPVRVTRDPSQEPNSTLTGP